jgi:hypothetical protein
VATDGAVEQVLYGQDGSIITANTIDMKDGLVQFSVGHILVNGDMSARTIYHSGVGRFAAEKWGWVSKLEVSGHLMCMPREDGEDLGNADLVRLSTGDIDFEDGYPILKAGTLTCEVPLTLSANPFGSNPDFSDIGLRLPFVETEGLLTIDDELISVLPPSGMSATIIHEEHAISIDLAPATPGDVNLDGSVDAADLIDLLNGWGACEVVEDLRQWCITDVDQEGDTDVRDLLQLLESWTG